jgi:diguanylate cyclase (GGDEF)-like protein
MPRQPKLRPHDAAPDDTVLAATMIPMATPAADLFDGMGEHGLAGCSTPLRINRVRAALAAAEARIANLQARIDYLESLSVTDELTGLLNRRGFTNEIERALAGARRSGQHGALLICDLDGFKAINDRYGHSSGDAVLRAVGRQLLRHVRRTDAVGRIGGDEFALLLVGASRSGSEQKIDALRRLIHETRIVNDGDEMSVGISIGGSFYTGAEEESELFHRADQAMYADKQRAHRRGRRAHSKDWPLISIA